ncbi:MAG: helix-turn-helix transcriptional regulator [Planctomycetes bacterium]|nr:helix-turn-helix transcriptional regulator [Planctomycetota bacterium]
MRHQTAILAGRKLQPPGYRFVTGQYDHFQVIYVSRGLLFFRVDGPAVQLREGSIAILRKASRFELWCERAGYRGVCCNIYSDLPQEMIGQSETLNATAELRALAALMELQINSPTPQGGLVLEGMGMALAWESVRLSQQRDASLKLVRSGQHWAQAVRAAIDANLHTASTPRQALANLPMSYRQLSRHFLNLYGVTPKQYQLSARIDEARGLLERSNLSATDIAIELGFASSQHFATLFRRIAGVPPLAWRVRARQAANR